jgi:HlyD family secretion protein
MDIARPEAAKARRRRRLIYSALSLGVLVAITLGLTRLKPAAPTVDRAQVWSDTVKRGKMLRQVRGNGALVPEEIHWIPATTPGRIERIRVLPGAQVKAETVLVELTNPEVEQATVDAEWQLKAAEADFNKLKVQQESERLNQSAQAAQLNSEYLVAKVDAEADAKLETEKLVARLTALRSRTKAEQLALRCELEQRRIAILEQNHQAQLAAQQAELERLRALLALKRKHLAELTVRAGINGVLQRLGEHGQLQVGQQLAAGANIARVADPAKLKAEIKVVETQAKDIAHDQKAVIDTRNGTVPGRVVRIDPAVQNGTVTVDISLDGPLPKGARPDLTVEGVIEIELLPDVLYVGRPVQGQPESTVGLFKLDAAGREARRVLVMLGRSSVSTIEILDGLREGDRVILSDMSQWDAHNRVRLN